MIFNRALAVSVVAVSLAFTGSLAVADPKPKNSKQAGSQEIANFYGGTSRVWKSCKGGVYYGGGWEAKAYCNRNGPSVGIGTWSVKNGKICSDLVWYWKDGDQVKSKKEDSRDCISHIVDADGKMWRRWNDDADWWSVQSIKDDKSGSKGFKFKSKYNQTARKLGL